MKLLSTLGVPSLFAFAVATSAAAQGVDREGVYDIKRDRETAPGVDVWLEQITYRFGERIRPSVASEDGAYVTIVRVTTDGELRVLYPRRPNEQRPFEQAQLVDNRLRYNGDQSFNLTESSGMGFVFAIASFQRFDFRSYAIGSQWSIGRLATVSSWGDPFAIIARFVEQVIPTTSDYSVDYVSYEVYSDNARRSRYANRYTGYYGVSDYFDLCVSSFGIRYTNFCRSYGVGYFGPGYYGPGYYGSTSGRPRLVPRNPAVAVGSRPRGGMRPRPLSPDPMVPGVPTEPAPMEGRLPDIRRNDAARMAELRARAMKRNGGRVITDPSVENRGTSTDLPRIYRPEPREYYPQRSEPRAMPQSSTRPEIYNAPRIERRMEQQRRPEPQVRADPRPMGRVDMPRSEPRIIRDIPGRVQAPQREKQ
ncbi:MAG TPA: hypothetical protein VM939_05060 [Gemmatimonadaceae bacterium]|nr:hypothetical protein [Gemmatimonadaceae bacterium]